MDFSYSNYRRHQWDVDLRTIFCSWSHRTHLLGQEEAYHLFVGQMNELSAGYREEVEVADLSGVEGGRRMHLSASSLLGLRIHALERQSHPLVCACDHDPCHLCPYLGLDDYDGWNRRIDYHDVPYHHPCLVGDPCRGLGVCHANDHDILVHFLFPDYDFVSFSLLVHLCPFFCPSSRALEIQNDGSV